MTCEEYEDRKDNLYSEGKCQGERVFVDKEEWE